MKKKAKIEKETEKETKIARVAKKGRLKTLCDYIDRIPFIKTLFSPFRKLIEFFSNWKRVLTIFVAGIIFLYYPIGAMLINNIDRDTNIEVQNTDPRESNTVNTMSYLINRELNEKMWTPNLPFVFPSYFLDNMPNYQLGVMSGVSTVGEAFAKRMGTQENLIKAGDLLQYSGKTWMFTPQNKLIPVPSANSQYRRARKHLLKYNADLVSGDDAFERKEEDLSFILGRISIDLSKSMRDIETQVREFSPQWFETKSDDVFYYNQGKLYSYYLLMKSLGYDYKDIIIENNLYQEWVKMLKALETGAAISPSIVRNGELDSITTPNHLTYLAFYTLKAQNSMQKIIINLELLRKKQNAN